MSARRPAALVLLALAACSRQAAPESPDLHHLEARLAWVGEDEDGLRVVAEPLSQPAPGLSAALPEEDMLRETLRLAPDRAMVRLHLVGPGSELQASGALEDGSGRRFLPMPEPEGLGPRARNLWLGVAAGGPPPAPGDSGEYRRSFVLLGEPGGARPGQDAPAQPLQWERDGHAVALQPRSWSDVERRKFLEPGSGTPPPEPPR